LEKFGQLRHGDLWLSGEGQNLGCPWPKTWWEPMVAVWKLKSTKVAKLPSAYLNNVF